MSSIFDSRNRFADSSSEEEEEDEQERLLSEQHGEAKEVSSSKKRAQTDQEIEAEYEKVKARKKPRPTLTPAHLIGSKGLVRIRHEFPKLKWPKNTNKTTAAASYSRALVQAYKSFCYDLFPASAFEDALSRIETFGSKKEVKDYLVTMREEVRNSHLESIFGKEKSQAMIQELEHGLRLQQLESDGYVIGDDDDVVENSRAVAARLRSSEAAETEGETMESNPDGQAPTTATTSPVEEVEREFDDLQDTDDELEVTAPRNTAASKVVAPKSTVTANPFASDSDDDDKEEEEGVEKAKQVASETTAPEQAAATGLVNERVEQTSILERNDEASPEKDSVMEDTASSNTTVDTGKLSSEENTKESPSCPAEENEAMSGEKTATSPAKDAESPSSNEDKAATTDKADNPHDDVTMATTNDPASSPTKDVESPSSNTEDASQEDVTMASAAAGVSNSYTPSPPKASTQSDETATIIATMTNTSPDSVAADTPMTNETMATTSEPAADSLFSPSRGSQTKDSTQASNETATVIATASPDSETATVIASMETQDATTTSPDSETVIASMGTQDAGLSSQASEATTLIASMLSNTEESP